MSLRHSRLVVLEPVRVERVVVRVDVLVRVHVVRDREHERAFRDLVRVSYESEGKEMDGRTV